MLDNIKAAFYARVSSEQQSKSGTINSQIQAILEKSNIDGINIKKELQFIDDGYSGSTLIRPALESLRDQAFFGAFNRLYVLNPFRLSRNYAYQFLLIDELKKNGVEIIFLNHDFKDNPEEQMLLQIQEIVSEYERAKIIERSRRGKTYAAKMWNVSVLANACYGYKYIDKASGDGTARYEIIMEEATVNEETKSLKLVILKLKDFAKVVEEKLDNIDFLTKREIIRSLVKEIKIGYENVEVVYRVNPEPYKKNN